MATPSIDEQLREQSKLLLRKLKDKQGKLQNIVNHSLYPDPATETKQVSDISPVENGRKPISNSLSNGKKIDDTSRDISVGKPARDGRKRLTKMSKEGKEQLNYDRVSNKENLEETHQKKALVNKDLDVQSRSASARNGDAALSQTVPMFAEMDMEFQTIDTDNANNNKKTDVKATGTPNVARRRKIIDKNIRVGNNGTVNLNESEILRECEEQFPRLNFSYSNVDDADLEYLQSKFGTKTSDDELDEIPVRDTEPMPENYANKLENPGNSRQFAKFIRDTSKPKSILLSTSQRHNKSAASKVSFRSPSKNSASGSLNYQMSESAQQAQRMLGYDWIAALIENDPNAVNQSETFFDDLKEFRKNNLEECVNDLYMDGPQELWEHPEREPEEVREALEETKVKPYLVNDRLFSEPIQRSLFAPYDYDDGDKSKESKVPTYEEPRFVRVSIPRSTLMSPHRVKPHRRRSFDNTDTMALSEHCLKGWTTSQPSTMPASSNIGLRDSSLGIRSTMKTTLDEAEKLAANYPYHWDPTEQKISRPVPKMTHRPEAAYMNDTGAWAQSFRSNPSSFTASSEGYKQATDDLLNSTHSLMYEMQRLKKERSDDPLRV